MEEGSNVIKPTDDDVSVLMAMIRESADDMGGEPGGCRSVCGGVSVWHGGIVLCFP